MTAHSACTANRTGAPVSSARAGYATFWVLIIGARAAFSYGSVDWFTRPLVRWAIANDVTAAALTDALIFMAVVMVLARTLSLGVRAARLPSPMSSPQPATSTD